MILPPNSLERCKNENDWLRLEIQCAINNNKNIVPVMMKGFEWPDYLPSSIDNIRNYNGLEMSREYFEASIEKIITLLNNVSLKEKQLDNKVNSFTPLERSENKYFSAEDIKELKRLKIQQNLMKEFDKESYKKIIDKYDELIILDIGSNNGDFVMDRIGKSSKTEKLIGLENDSLVVSQATEKYGNDYIKFYQCDVEDESFTERLSEIADEMQIEKFNVVNISMVILHLKNPYKVLKAVRKFMSNDGTIIIKDIDDGINYAYPDDNGDFARVIEMCSRNETSGYRYSGRQIYTLLKRAGYVNIKLEKCGLSTIGMDCDEREALFDTYFSFILDDCKIMTERYPNKLTYKEDYKWYKNIYDDLEERFQDETFVFSLGFMIYTASKKY